MEKYRSFNTQKRNKTENEVEHKFYKLFNKDFFGKMPENIRNGIKIGFVRKRYHI